MSVKGDWDRTTQAEKRKAVIYCKHDRFQDRCEKCREPEVKSVEKKDENGETYYEHTYTLNSGGKYFRVTRGLKKDD